MQPRKQPSWALVLIGPAIVAVLFVSIFMIKPFPAKDLSGEEIAIVFGVIWTTIPFLVLKVARVHSILSWSVAFLLMSGFYAFAVYDAAIRANGESGPNIGLGLIFLILPFMVTGICLAINQFVVNREIRDRDL